jgi:hypothetical protein
VLGKKKKSSNAVTARAVLVAKRKDWEEVLLEMCQSFCCQVKLVCSSRSVTVIWIMSYLLRIWEGTINALESGGICASLLEKRALQVGKVLGKILSS